ncbi:hypothetical protein Hdeb2414_s0007g00241801 [Helianthus debilis subsp. tardiflorus]
MSTLHRQQTHPHELSLSLSRHITRQPESEVRPNSGATTPVGKHSHPPSLFDLENKHHHHSPVVVRRLKTEAEEREKPRGRDREKEKEPAVGGSDRRSVRLIGGRSFYPTSPGSDLSDGAVEDDRRRWSRL